jgi:hypothetical protein
MATGQGATPVGISHYRWLPDLLAPHGTVLLAHPQRLRTLTLRRNKTDRLDSRLLAQLFRLGQVPLVRFPARRLQMRREMIRFRGQPIRGSDVGEIWAADAAGPAQPGGAVPVPVRATGGCTGLAAGSSVPVDDCVRDELPGRFELYRK